MKGVLHERDTERAAIVDALADACERGLGRALFIRGEPGLGKTSLLFLAASQAAERFGTVRAGGHEMEQAYPYAVVHQVVESLLRTYGRQGMRLAGEAQSLRSLLQRSARAGAGRPADDTALARAELLHAFYWLVASLAEQKPLLLCMDDLHWSDPDSLDAVRFLTLRLEPLPVVLVGALRPWPPQAAEIAERLAWDGRAQIANLSPLSPPAATNLLGVHCGAMPSAERAAEAYALTGGNPFLIGELARAWESEAGAGSRRAPGPNSLVLTRLAGLPAGCLRLLQAASVLGPEFDLEVALALAGGGSAAAADILAPVEHLGLLRRRAGGRAAFLHPLTQQAVYDGLASSERRALHQAAVKLLRARGARAVELVPHVTRVAHHGDPAALTELCAAAAEAAVLGAWDSAAVHLREAVAFGPPGPERAAILYELGRACQRAGSHKQSCAAFDEAVGIPGCAPRLRALVHRSWAFSLTLAGEVVPARDHLQQAVAIAVECDAALAAETAVARVVFEMTTRGMRHAEEAAEDALRLASASGEPAAEPKAWAAWSNVAFQRGEPLALARIREACAHLPEGPPDESELLWGWSPRIALGMIAMRSEHYEEAGAPLLEAWESACARRERYARLWASTFLAELNWRRGRLHDAFRYSGDLLVYPQGVPWATALALTVRGLVLMEMGDLDGAEACLARSEEEGRQAGLGVAQASSAVYRAVLAARRGSSDAALAVFRQVAGVMDVLGVHDPDSFRWRREASEAFVRAGRLEEGRRLAEELLAGARQTGRLGLEAAAWRCMGLLEGIEGHVSAAERAFSDALALYKQVDEALERGRTLLAYGTWLRRTGEMKRARAVLDEACVVCEGCGSAYWQRQAESERRSAGGRRRTRPQTGHLGWLTPQEYRVAELVHQGCSNRQIACLLLVSPKTLETHLHHIYSKLAITSRVQLREYFGRYAPAAAAAVERVGVRGETT